MQKHWTEEVWPNGVPTPDAGGQPAWDNNDYSRDFIWLGQPREGVRMEKPSIGRMVHYVAYGTPGGEFPAGVCRAAVITEVDSEATSASEAVGILVMNPTGLFFNQHIPHNETKAPGSWHWPERT